MKSNLLGGTMVFSRYVLDFLNEDENEESEMNLVDRTNEVKAIINKIADSDIKKELLKNVELFGLKGGSVINFNSSNLPSILKMMKNPKKVTTTTYDYQIPSIEIVKKTQTPKYINFRSTTNKIVAGNAIQQKGGGSNTKYQEIGPLIYLAMLIDQNADSKNLDISNVDLKKLSRIKTGSAEDIRGTIKFLAGDKSWEESCKQQAIDIYKKFGDKLNQYDFHHGTSEFKQIKNTGASLSGISADKWNPSDIFFIKSLKLNGIDNIVELNDYVGSHDDIIGVSLKKGESDARMGKFAIENVYKLMGALTIKGHDQIIKNAKLNGDQIKEIIAALKQIKALKSPKVYFCTTRDGKLKDGITTCLKNAKIEGKNFGKSYFRVVSFLSNFKTQQDLEDTMFLMLEVAKSQASVSCPHYKWASKLFLVEPGLIRDKYEFKKLRIPVDGDMSAVCEVIYDGARLKMQIRSFGSLPQVEIIPLNKEEKQTDSALAKSVDF